MNGEIGRTNPTVVDRTADAQIPTALLSRDREVPVIETQNADVASEDGQLAPLFLPDVTKEFRSRWDAVQGSFVDDPRQSVRQADELVAQVMKSLAETFSNERGKLETQVDQTDEASTENLRLGLRRYRSFFERLLSL